MKLERRTRERRVAKISLLTSGFLIAVLVCVACSLLFFPLPQSAQITIPIFVGNTSDTIVAGACTQMGNPANCSLRGAIHQANAGSSNSVIRFSIPASDPSCSAGVCTINLTASLPTITSPVSIVGPGPDKLTVRPVTGGQFNILAINATGSSVSISGLTISNAISPGGSGGIANGNGTLTVTNCVISGNQATTTGGGISNGDTLNIVNSTISNNQAQTGGGIVSFGTLNVTNSTISGNHSVNGGEGGGIYSIGTANIINSTLNANTTNTHGAAIVNAVGTLNVSNSTITGNTANAEVGGGIFNVDGAIANIKSSIIASNAAPSGPDVFGAFVSSGFNLIGKINGSTGFPAATDQTGSIASPLNPMLDTAGPQNNGGTTLTWALLPGSPAIDKGTRAGLLGILTTDQRGGIYDRLRDNFAVSNAPGGDGTDIGAFELQSNAPADFDGDNKTDIGIFRPFVGEWWINRSTTGSAFATQFGQSTDKIAPGDFTGDGKADIAVWRPSNGFWFILRSENFSYFAFPFGTNGDIPAPLDSEGDDVTDETVFRPSSGTWFIIRSFDGGSVRIERFGTVGDVPVPGDYDGDGAADLAIFRPSLGQWWISQSTAGVIVVTFGNSLDKPVQGDYTGDGKTDIAFWRPSTGHWFVLRSEDFSFFSFAFGTNGDIPAPGDYDGDGKYDATVFRPSTGTWFSNRTTAGILIQQFGVNGDRPIPNAFVP